MCADLTVNPILIDWNKNLAARLKPFPGLEMGLLETNGDLNYRNWEKMLIYHPVSALRGHPPETEFLNWVRSFTNAAEEFISLRVTTRRCSQKSNKRLMRVLNNDKIPGNIPSAIVYYKINQPEM